MYISMYQTAPSVPPAPAEKPSVPPAPAEKPSVPPAPVEKPSVPPAPVEKPSLHVPVSEMSFTSCKLHEASMLAHWAYHCCVVATEKR